MRRWLSVLCVLLVLFVLRVGAHAEEENPKDDLSQPDTEIAGVQVDYEKTAVNKLGRGVINTATCWAEIPAQVSQESKEKNPAVGIPLGILKGTFTTVLRGISGVFDAATFVYPPYDKPIMKPEYALKNLDDKIKDYLW